MFHSFKNTLSILVLRAAKPKPLEAEAPKPEKFHFWAPPSEAAKVRREKSLFERAYKAPAFSGLRFRVGSRGSGRGVARGFLRGGFRRVLGLEVECLQPLASRDASDMLSFSARRSSDCGSCYQYCLNQGLGL